MRKITLLIFSIIASVGLYAQPYGNEWITVTPGNPYSDQDYYKLAIAKDGIYRLSYNDLQLAGFPLNTDPRATQLFAYGKEQYIHIQGENDGTWNQGDYIEFLGFKNDGRIDTAVYLQASYQKNDKLSLFNDTVWYFLTINSLSINNKRMVVETDINYNNYLPSPFCMTNVFVGQPTNYLYYHDGYHDFYNTSLSAYVDGEGWAVFDVKTTTVASTHTYTIPTPNSSNGNPSILKTLIAGRSAYDHNYEIKVNGSVKVNDVVSGSQYKEHDIFFTNGSGSVKIDCKAFPNPGGDATPNYFWIRYYDLLYAHSYNFVGELQNFYAIESRPSLSTGKSRVSLSNLALGQPLIYAISGDTIKKIPSTANGNVLEVVLPTNFQNMKTYIGTDTSIVTNANNALKFQKVDYKDAPLGKFHNYGFNTTYDYLLITHRQFWNEAEAYKNYRTNNPIKNYNVLQADIDELIDQFAYGVVNHPLAVQSFCNYAYDNFTGQPRNVFLVGKGYDPAVAYSFKAKPYIPTFGHSPSDLMMTTRLSQQDSILRPHMAIGRLPAVAGYEVQDYLQKMQQYESEPRQEWMKNVLHFAGGSNPNENFTILSHMNGFKEIIEDTCFGGYVRTISKTINDPIQINLSANLQNIIDSGVTLMTFFAHAASSNFDISTDVPSSWKNKKRYPLIIANSCYVGNIHLLNRYAAEDFVMQKEKGAIGFIAQSSQGYIHTLRPYTQNLYKNIAYYNYRQSIGEQMLSTIDTMMNKFNEYGLGIFEAASVALDMALLGDPAMHLNSAEKPDYIAKSSDIQISPANLNTSIDSLTLRITIRNAGKAFVSPLNVRVTRVFPNQAMQDTILSLPYVTYTDTVTITLPVDRAQGAGINTFMFDLDYNNEIDESIESNNFASLQVHIKSNDINGLFPVKYAIIPNNTTTLVSATANPLAPPTKYVFQIDTVDFEGAPSPFFQELKVTAPGGIVKWTLPFTLTEDLVYYWRVARDSVPGDIEHPYWDELSFVYKQGKTGWSQGHIYQFKNDDYRNIEWNRPNKNFNFVTTGSILKANNNNYNDNFAVNFFINGKLEGYNSCFSQGATSAVNVVVIDEVSLIPWNNREPGRSYGNYNNTPSKCNPNRPDNYFVFPCDSQTFYSDSLADMLLNKIPNGKYVLIYNVKNGWRTKLKPVAVNAINSLGSQVINFIPDDNCWIYFFQKGNPNFNASEVVGDNANPLVSIQDTLGGNWDKGFIYSERIGPGVKWQSLHWENENIETADSISLDVFALDGKGNQKLIIDNLSPATTDVFNLDQLVNDTTMNYMNMVAYMQDTNPAPDPVFLKKWQIFYQELPEAMADPSLHLYVSSNNPQEADTITISTAIKNIGNEPMDSMLVAFYVYDKSNKRIDFPSVRYKKLNPGDTLHCSIRIPTLGLGGNNTLWIEANPANDQLEQYHFNNYASISFKVNTDITNPLLDVTFDGVHILNGDIVSAKPGIRISFKDENKLLAMDDTSDFYVTLAKQGTFQPQRWFYEPVEGTTTSPQLLTWRRAKLPANKFEIEINPELADGLYELQVQGTDKSNNPSGVSNHKISFEVINKASITHMMNYPNPFSTSTRFAFTITGSEVPEYIRIQIMTVSGKVIREINTEELGPLHIGRNITKYAWDGRDEFGDQLANGVYLYRVITRLNGEGIEHRETEADKFFNDGWGKMYLLR